MPVGFQPWKSRSSRRRSARRGQKNAVARAGLDPEATFYALRHASVTRMLKAGVPTQAVGEHHGTSARMIELNYAKFIPGDLARYAALAAPALRVDLGEAAEVTRLAG